MAESAFFISHTKVTINLGNAQTKKFKCQMFLLRYHFFVSVQKILISGETKSALQKSGDAYEFSERGKMDIYVRCLQNVIRLVT